MQRVLGSTKRASSTFFGQCIKQGGTMSGLVRCLLGMGNPLLDVMSNIDQAFLDKYGVCQSIVEHTLR